MQIGLIELFGMEEIKQYINLQMRKMLEIFEKIIKFDIFFSRKRIQKKQIDIQLYCFYIPECGILYIHFSRKISYKYKFIIKSKDNIIYTTNLYFIYYIVFQLVLLHQKINIIIHHNLFYTDICDIFYILVYLSKIHPQFGHKHDVSIIIMM